jgi:ABC-2 type transport system permease protein
MEIMAGETIVSIIFNLTSGLLFLVFFGMFALSIGVFVSTITSNQLLCSTITFIMILFFYFIGYVANLIPHAPTFIKEYMNFPEFLNSFCDGIIDSRPLVFCFSGTVLFLLYSIRVLEVSKHR